MPRPLDAIDNVLDEHDAALAQAAQRCLMAALDHSRASKIRLVTDGKNMPSVELPPKALRMVADMLGMMAQRQPVVLLPQKMELSTQDAAASSTYRARSSSSRSTRGACPAARWAGTGASCSMT